IRDYKVTGVQTCALPIWRSQAELGNEKSGPLAPRTGGPGAPIGAVHGVPALPRSRSERATFSCSQAPLGNTGARNSASRHVVPRSEERRVGKGCRDRWVG